MTPQTDATEPESIGLAGLAPVETLGQQWAAQAQLMAGRRLPARPWLHALAPVLGRLAALPAPVAARFQRVELGAEPLPVSPRLRPSREDAGTGDVGYMAGRAESSDFAPIDGHTLLASDVRPRATIVPNVSSVGGPAVEPTRDASTRPAEAPVSPETRVRDTILPSVNSVAGSVVETAGDRDARPEGAPVSRDVHLRLRDLVGPSIPAMRVRDDVQADAVARSRQADAVTVGNQVLFRADRYRPHTPQGLALLAHEAVHAVEAQQANVAWQRATSAGRADEEHQALAVERATLRSAQGTTAGIGRAPVPTPSAPSPLRGVLPGQAAAASQAAWSLPPMPASEGAGSPAAAMQPMAAAASRDLQEEPAPATPAPSFQELREALYRDLMRQLRADFERGG